MTVTPNSPSDSETPALTLPGPMSAVFAVLGRRWSYTCSTCSGLRPARFTELRHAIPGISANSLNERLRDLVGEGLVLRRTFPGPPMSSSYETTPVGQAIGEHLIRMGAPHPPSPRGPPCRLRAQNRSP
jgi:DNA-binding HxlR family transcriptional regulator